MRGSERQQRTREGETQNVQRSLVLSTTRRCVADEGSGTTDFNPATITILSRIQRWSSSFSSSVAPTRGPKPAS